MIPSADPTEERLSEHAAPDPVSDYYADDLVNHFRLTGTIVALDRRQSGTTTITVQAGSLPDKFVAGSQGTRLFTSRFLIRVPPRLKAKWPDRLLRASPSIVTVTGRLHGIIEIIDGREYLLQEMVAQDIRFIARHGIVATHSMHWFRPVEDSERADKTKPKDSEPIDDTAGPSAEPEPEPVSANPAGREAS